MFHIPFPSSLTVSLVKEGWAWWRRRHRRLTPAEIVELRHKWKPKFDDYLADLRRDNLRSDVVIRDMRRIDQYPDIEEKRNGISPWFRVGLVGTYHRGIMLGLRWESLKQLPDGAWKIADYKAGEEDGLNALLIGYVRFEDIESIDWDGDEFYGCPHIYCYFNGKKNEPYEKVAFCQKVEIGDYPYYKEITNYSNVQK